MIEICDVTLNLQIYSQQFSDYSQSTLCAAGMCVRSTLNAVIINGSIVRYDTVIVVLINFKLRFDIIIAADTDVSR